MKLHTPANDQISSENPDIGQRIFSSPNDNGFKQPSSKNESRGISGSFAPLSSLNDKETMKFFTV